MLVEPPYPGASGGRRNYTQTCTAQYTIQATSRYINIIENYNFLMFQIWCLIYSSLLGVSEKSYTSFHSRPMSSSIALHRPWPFLLTSPPQPSPSHTALQCCAPQHISVPNQLLSAGYCRSYTAAHPTSTSHDPAPASSVYLYRQM